jgi:hypothetical protein
MADLNRQARSAAQGRTEEVEDLLDTIYNALGWIEPGRGDEDYRAAKAALAQLADILGVPRV